MPAQRIQGGGWRRLRRGDDGAVLVYALWVLSGLSFLAVQAAALSRYSALEVRWAWEELQRREAIHSWIRLTSQSQVRDWLLPLNRWVSCSVGDYSFWVRRENEKSKTSVNQGDALRLRRTIEEVLGPHGDPRLADRLVDSIMDWRDADSLVRASGAEKEAYQQRGLPPPSDSPFTSLCEVRLVMGVTSELFWGRPWEEAAWEAAARREGLATLEAAPKSLAGSLSAVGGSGIRLTFLFPRSDKGYDVEIVVFNASQKHWSLLDRCRGFVRSGDAL